MNSHPWPVHAPRSRKARRLAGTRAPHPALPHEQPSMACSCSAFAESTAACRNAGTASCGASSGSHVSLAYEPFLGNNRQGGVAHAPGAGVCRQAKQGLRSEVCIRESGGHDALRERPAMGRGQPRPASLTRFTCDAYHSRRILRCHLHAASTPGLSPPAFPHEQPSMACSCSAFAESTAACRNAGTASCGATFTPPPLPGSLRSSISWRRGWRAPPGRCRGRAPCRPGSRSCGR